MFYSNENIYKMQLSQFLINHSLKIQKKVESYKQKMKNINNYKFFMKYNAEDFKKFNELCHYNINSSSCYNIIKSIEIFLDLDIIDILSIKKFSLNILNFIMYNKWAISTELKNNIYWNKFLELYFLNYINYKVEIQNLAFLKNFYCKEFILFHIHLASLFNENISLIFFDNLHVNQAEISEILTYDRKIKEVCILNKNNKMLVNFKQIITELIDKSIENIEILFPPLNHYDLIVCLKLKV